MVATERRLRDDRAAGRIRRRDRGRARSDGRVRNDLTLASLTGGTRESRTLKGTLGQGGNRLTLRDRRRHDPAHQLLTRLLPRPLHGVRRRDRARLPPQMHRAARGTCCRRRSARSPSCGFMHDSDSSSGTPSSAPSLITSSLCRAVSGVTIAMRAPEAERQRARHRVEEFRRRVRKRVVGERAQGEPGTPQTRAQHGGLREQHDVAAFEVDVLVGRVVRAAAGRRPPSASAGTRRACRQSSVAAARRPANGGVPSSRSIARARRPPRRIPTGREPVAPARCVATLERQQHGAVEAAREQHADVPTLDAFRARTTLQ